MPNPDAKLPATPDRPASGQRVSTSWWRVRDLSITAKLALNALSLVVVVAILMVLVALTFEVSAAMRAYVGGEGLYSKAQKDAVYHLTRYVRTRQAADYANYLQAVAVPLGDHRARLELERPSFEAAVATEGFLQGGNAAADIPGMIWLFRRFHDVSYMRQAIELWRQADDQVLALVRCAEELHAAIAAGQLDAAGETRFLDRVHQINLALNPLEQQFSATLATGAREIRQLLLQAVVLSALLLLCAGLWVSFRISRTMRDGILGLRTAALRVAHGDLDHRVVLQTRDELGELAGVFNTMIQQRRVTEEQLRAATEFRDKIMESVTNAIYVIDLEGRFILVNQRTCSMTGYSEPELTGMLFDQLFPAEQLADIRQRFEAVVRTGVPIEHYESPLIRRSGDVITISFSSAALYDKSGNIIGVVGAAEDITERKLHDARLAHLANYDVLTGLPNRNLLNDRITQALSRAQRTGHAVAVLFIDLDGFKFVNDSFGHRLGDLLLQGVAQELKGAVRACDTVARLGGDEFVVMLDEIHAVDDILDIGNKLLRLFARTFDLNGRELRVSASIGASRYPSDALDCETLLKHADIAMYAAKASGRNRLEFFTRDMGAEVVQRVELEVALRTALEQNQFEVHYQPQIDLASGRIRAAEALIRWNRGLLGAVPPSRFIPIAEETGLILPIGAWVLRTACRELARWHQAGHRLAMTVNVSARQLQQEGIPRLVREVLHETGVPPDCLHLELTESVILRHSETIVGSLQELKAMGVVLAVDDFGTGYSSLAYLKRFPIGIIKIDQSFTQDLGISSDAAAIIRAIIAMAKSLNMKTIAEGVETREQLRFLIDNGCDLAQGFYMSRALPAAAFLERVCGDPPFVLP